MPNSIAIRTEPRGDTYRALIDYLGTRCSSFSLVWREQLPFDDTAHAVADRLRRFLLREDRTDEWPGTRLVGHMATVRHYRCHHDSLAVLKEQPSLFAWEANALPEDPAFYDATGRCAFGSISHERNAWFDLELLDVKDIEASVPGIELRLRVE